MPHEQCREISVSNAPPRNIEAEPFHGKRAAILEAEGLRQAAILKAEGAKQSSILSAEGDRQSTILQAEGQREAAFRAAEARERSAEAEAKATAMVSEAIAKGDVQAINYFLGLKYVEALQQVAVAPNQKLIMMPLEASSVIGALGGITELAKSALSQQQASSRVPKAGA